MTSRREPADDGTPARLSLTRSPAVRSIQRRLHSSELSDSREVLLRLRWLAILSGLLRKTKLAVTGGVHTATNAIKAVMCGASAVQVVAGVLRSGPERLRVMRVEMKSWMAEHEYTSRFRELAALAECYDFVFIRQGGSHEIYKREGYAKNMVFQNVKGMAKAYQVKQRLDALRELGLIE